MKKKITCIFLVFCLLLSFATPVFAKSAKAQITSQTKTFMKQVKKYNENGITKCFQPKKYRSGVSIWKQNSYEAKMVRKIQKDHFKYKILKVKASGKTGYAKVRVTYFDAYDLYYNAFDETIMDVLNGSVKEKNSQKALYKHLRQDYRDILATWYDEDDIGKTNKTVTVSIPFIKRNGKWKIKKATKAMTRFMDCRFSEALSDWEADNPWTE